MTVDLRAIIIEQEHIQQNTQIRRIFRNTNQAHDQKKMMAQHLTP